MKKSTKADCANSIGEIADKIRGLRQRACENVIAIGRLLVDAKGQLAHGEWGEWLRREFAWSQDTAENLLNVSRVFGKEKSATFRSLDVSSLYLLAKPSTPQEARDTVAKLIEADVPPDLAAVKRIIREEKGTDAADAARKEARLPRQQALADQFTQAIMILLELAARPSSAFTGIVTADDLDMLGNFLKQIAAASRKAA